MGKKVFQVSSQMKEEATLQNKMWGEGSRGLLSVALIGVEKMVTMADKTL